MNQRYKILLVGVIILSVISLSTSAAICLTTDPDMVTATPGAGSFCSDSDLVLGTNICDDPPPTTDVHILTRG